MTSPIIPRYCRRPGCPHHADLSGYCPAHSKKVRGEIHRGYDRGRDADLVAFYKSALWQRVRRVMLGKFPVCQDCQLAPSTEVHHIQKAETKQKRLAFSNLMALCKGCHAKRTARGE